MSSPANFGKNALQHHSDDHSLTEDGAVDQPSFGQHLRLDSIEQTENGSELAANDDTFTPSSRTSAVFRPGQLPQSTARIKNRSGRKVHPGSTENTTHRTNLHAAIDLEPASEATDFRIDEYPDAMQLEAEGQLTEGEFLHFEVTADDQEIEASLATAKDPSQLNVLPKILAVSIVLGTGVYIASQLQPSEAKNEAAEESSGLDGNQLAVSGPEAISGANSESGKKVWTQTDYFDFDKDRLIDNAESVSSFTYSTEAGPVITSNRTMTISATISAEVEVDSAVTEKQSEGSASAKVDDVVVESSNATTESNKPATSPIQPAADTGTLSTMLPATKPAHDSSEQVSDSIPLYRQSITSWEVEIARLIAKNQPLIARIEYRLLKRTYPNAELKPGLLELLTDR